MGLADPMFLDPFVDVDEWRDEPVRHRYVHGGFEGTECRFSLYFPEARRYQGRFFQPVQPVPGSEHGATEGMTLGYIEFVVASGAYLVESNLGLRRRALPGEDSTVAGFRASAAVATYSRVLAAEMYGEHRPFGYVFGGSGGAYRTMACIENTRGVWDGAVPYIHGTPMSMPSMFSVQAHAMRILMPKLTQIVDAIEPGGSGDPYAGLDVEEREALAEATRMGFPLRAWFDAERVALQYTTVWAGLFDWMVSWDPTYFDDFWTVPGYLGANPTDSLLQAKLQHKTTVAEPIMRPQALALGLPLPLAMAGQHIDDVPVAFRLDELPDADLAGAMLQFTTGGAAGHNVWISGLRDGIVTTGIGQAQFDSLRAVAVGDDVLLDNTAYLAFQTYHRHQVPPAEYPGWGQFRAAGESVYPQRPQLLGPRYGRNGAGGGIQAGRFDGKMIVVQCLLDEIAYPQQAAWYHRRVQGVLGDGIADRYRVWFVDHAMHGGPMMGPKDSTQPARNTRIVNYRGVLEQALRDLAAWVEQGVAPPASTAYELVDGQIVVAPTAAERGGIQPVVTLTANGGTRAEVVAGETVDLAALVEVSSGAGTIVAAAFDFEGTGEFADVVPFGNEATSYTSTTFTASHTFTTPGTFFPSLHVTAQRRGQMDERFARVENLGRVRVVVA
jgi:hypothetical protein